MDDHFEKKTYIEILKKLLILFFSNRISKKFSLEVQLMHMAKNRIEFLRRLFYHRIYYRYNCEVSHLAKIDKSVSFVHPIGIVIGSNAVIEEDCSIYQNVTLGSDFDKNNEMPYIKKGTRIGSGAKVIGGVTVGENCIIGANAVVTKDIPDNSIVVGANIIKERK